MSENLRGEMFSPANTLDAWNRSKIIPFYWFMFRFLILSKTPFLEVWWMAGFHKTILVSVTTSRVFLDTLVECVCVCVDLR